MQHLLGALTLAFALGVTVPQIVVSLGRGHWDGLSFAAIANSAASSAAWVVYGCVHVDGWLISTSVAYAVCFGALSVTMVWRASCRQAELDGVGFVVMWAVALGAALACLPYTEAVLVVALTAGIWVSSVPQVVRAWRAPRTAGISVTSWAVVVLDALVWSAYGLVSGLPALVTWGASAIVLGIAVIVGALRGHRHGTDEAAAQLAPAR